MEGIGVVFDIDALQKQDDCSSYGDTAWRILMRNLRPEKIIGCMLREGDTRETLSGSHREFCIGIFCIGLDVEVVKAAFVDSSENGLAPPNRRFILGSKLESEPLSMAGVIDSFGKFVEDEWSRIFHDRCKDCGWGYAPRRITVDLSAELKAELKAMQEKTVPCSSGTGRSVTSPPRVKKKPWWKFWT